MTQSPSANNNLFAAIGTQTPPSFRRASRIAVQGIRIRMGRSLITLSGVVLGTAFLMSNVTTQFVDHAVARERDARRQLVNMESVLNSQIGSLRGKTLAVAVFGALSPLEMNLLARIREAQPAAARIYGMPALPGFTASGLPGLGRGAAVVLLLGDAPVCPAPLAALTEGMPTRLVLDARADRQCQCEPQTGIRRELFFGRQLKDQLARLTRQAAQERFRIIWIVIISLAVTIIGVANALLMSVTERFREIGTMKCLGALSSFIRQLFLIESSLIGLAGSIIGALLGAILAIVAYGFTYQFTVVLSALPYGWLAVATLSSIVAGSILSVLAALYPARFASRMVPASALRSTV